MTTLDWGAALASVTVPAAPAGFWTPALDYVTGPALLRFVAAGTWRYAFCGKCGPDGDTTSLLFRDQAQLPQAPIGALIAKVGGSTAGWQDSPTLFLVGSACVFSLPVSVAGPLYLGMNDEFSGMRNNSGSVSVTIYSKPST